MMNKRRLFIAIDSPVIKEKIMSYLEGKNWPAGFRFVGPDNLHLTVLFLGEINEEQIVSIITALKELTSQLSPFPIELNQIDYGPSPQRPRLVWFYGPYSPFLDQLKANLEELLEAKGVRFSKDRRLLPHLTLFRLKNEDSHSLPPLKDKLALSFEAQSLKLMESHLAKGGAQYETLMECPFSLKE